MTTIFTYDSLFAEILKYLERNDEEIRDQVSTFIMLATRRISKESKTLGLKNIVFATMTTGQYFLAKPGNWRSTATVTCVNNKGEQVPNNPTYGDKFPLDVVSYSFCELYAPNPDVTGKPKYYADFDYYNWYIAPTPDFDYLVVIGFFENDLLVDDLIQTNFLIANAPELMLKASLLEAQFYVKDKSMIPIWQMEYKDQLASFNREDTLRTFDSFSRRETE